jgi:hypothetical protein
VCIPTALRASWMFVASAPLSAMASSPASSPQKRRVISGCIEERRKRGPATAERAAKRPGAERQGNGDHVSGCAPENVGVAPGYATMLEALANPGHKCGADSSARKSIHPLPPSNTGANRWMRLTSKD